MAETLTAFAAALLTVAVLLHVAGGLLSLRERVPQRGGENREGGEP